MSAVDWALKQDEIKNDPKGQWAIEATASSTYGDAKGMASYSANQVVGGPSVDHYGDNTSSWVPKTEDGGIEWIDLKFPKPVHATEVRVRESCGSGAVIKVELFDEQGAGHAVWAGNDPTKDLNYLMVKFPKTAYKTARVKVTLATNVVPAAGGDGAIGGRNWRGWPTRLASAIASILHSTDFQTSHRPQRSYRRRQRKY
jgi:hypothetical protein